MRKTLLSMVALLFLAGACITEPMTMEEPAAQEKRMSEQDLIEAVRADPDDYEPRAALAFYYFAWARQPNLASKHYEKAIEIAGRRVYTHPHYFLGHCYREMKEFDKALKEWDDCYQVPEEEEGDHLVDVNYRLSQYWSCVVLAEAKGDPEKAATYIERFRDRGGALNEEINLFGILAWSYAHHKKDAEKAGLYLAKVQEGQVKTIRLEMRRKMISAKDIESEILRLREETANASD